MYRLGFHAKYVSFRNSQKKCWICFEIWTDTTTNNAVDACCDELYHVNRQSIYMNVVLTFHPKIIYGCV